MSDTLTLQKAVLLAGFFHCGQLYGDEPYAVHLGEVARVLEEFGFREPSYTNLLAAAYLHDVIEDTDASLQNLWDLGISREITVMVWAVTDEPGENRKERKAKTYPKIVAAGEQAIALKLADRIANVRRAKRSGILDKDWVKWRMYKGEYIDFCSGLYTEEGANGILKPMWLELDRLLDAKANERYWG